MVRSGWAFDPATPGGAPGNTTTTTLAPNPQSISPQVDYKACPGCSGNRKVAKQQLKFRCEKHRFYFHRKCFGFWAGPVPTYCACPNCKTPSPSFPYSPHSQPTKYPKNNRNSSVYESPKLAHPFRDRYLPPVLSHRPSPPPSVVHETPQPFDNFKIRLI